MRTHEVLMKYQPLIMRLVHNPYTRLEFLRDENGDLTDTWGIVILTSEEIDQYALNAEDRMPNHLKGVPVQILSHDYIWIRERSWSPGFDPVLGNSHKPYAFYVERKNRDLIHRYPFFSKAHTYMAVPGKDPSDSDALDRIYGISVYVTEKVDLSTLSPEDRIPECLEDVPVRIEVWPE